MSLFGFLVKKKKKKGIRHNFQARAQFPLVPGLCRQRKHERDNNDIIVVITFAGNHLISNTRYCIHTNAIPKINYRARNSRTTGKSSQFPGRGGG